MNYDFEVQKKHEYLHWVDMIPSFNFDLSWNVQIIPPFGGAIIRFHILGKERERLISVFLDCYDNLGLVGEPYWEVYNFKDKPVRFLLARSKELMDYITRQMASLTS